MKRVPLTQNQLSIVAIALSWSASPPGLDQEDATLRQLNQDIAKHGDAFFDWVNTHGQNAKTAIQARFVKASAYLGELVTEPLALPTDPKMGIMDFASRVVEIHREEHNADTAPVLRLRRLIVRAEVPHLELWIKEASSHTRSS